MSRADDLFKKISDATDAASVQKPLSGNASRKPVSALDKTDAAFCSIMDEETLERIEKTARLKAARLTRDSQN
ncbi:hypothetical protein RPE78_12180 [Thioclava litoralis]|uniref:Uncharacterized protein n=1 Tax=Thioclava litoralis TaxID=3076557 RepID=A0ABZ1DXB5_9RHOB|nr:hypothetical protein RPE78_12180 [Thioclava sp. FTW29]